MANYTSVLNLCYSIRDKVTSLTDNTDKAISEFLPNLDDLSFDEAGSYTADAEMTPYLNIIDYLRNSGNQVSFCINNEYITTISLVHSTEIIEGVVRDRDVVKCLNNEGEDIDIFGRMYSEGLGDYYIRNYGNSMISLNGDEIDIFHLEQQLMSGWASNTVVVTALNCMIPYITRGLVWNSNTIDQFTSDFRDSIATKLDVNNINMKGAVELYHVIIDQCRGGVTGILGCLKSLYSSTSTVQEGSTNNFEFIDNEQFASTDFFNGVIQSVSSIIQTLATILLTTGSKIIGLIALVVSFITEVISRFVNTEVDKLTFAYYKPDGGLTLPEYPFSLWNYTLTSGNGYYDPFVNEYGYLLNNEGAVLITTPFFAAYIWKIGDAATDYDIGIQLRPIGMTQHNNHAYSFVTTTDDGTDITSITYDFSGFQNESTFADFMSLSFYAQPNMDLDGIEYTSSEMDSVLKYRCKGVISDMAMYIAFFYCLLNHQSSYTAEDWEHNELDMLMFMAYYQFNATSLDPFVYFKNASWDVIIGQDDDVSDYMIGYFQGKFINEILFMLIHFSECANSYEQNLDLQCVTSCRSIPEANISIPKYDRGQFIMNLVITGVVIAATIAVAAVVTVRAKKYINQKRATNAALSEKAWETYKANPTTANYKSYRKAVKKNNRFVSLFGGTKYSTEGFWAASDSNTSEINNTLDSINSNADNDLTPLDEGDILGTTTLIKLIKGSD